MKKRAKTKTSKKTAKRKKTAQTDLPDLVTVMTKLVERLEALERKNDQILGRVSNIPLEIRNLAQNMQRSGQQSSHPVQNTPPENSPREKILYEAVCADCCKSCKVPFKPREGRPVYCPECFAIRKAGHVPKDITSGIKIPQFPVLVKASEAALSKRAGSEKKKKGKPAKSRKKVSKKKK